MQGGRFSGAVPVLTAAAGLLMLPAVAGAVNGVWTNTVSGAWGDTNNWNGGIVAAGLSGCAYFDAVDIVNNVTVHLDAPRTSGSLVFGDTATNTPAGWTLDDGGAAGNILTLTNITVNALGTDRNATVSAGIVIGGGYNTVNTAAAGSLNLAGAVQPTLANATLQKTGIGVLTMAGACGSPAIRPALLCGRGTVALIGNSVHVSGIRTPNGVGDVNILTRDATINVAGDLELQTVYSTGVFDMRGGSLTVGQIGLADAGNFGANESVMTLDDGAVVNASSGIRSGNRTDTGGGASFVLKDGVVNAGGGTIVIGIRKGENFFNQLGGAVTCAAVLLQWRMNVTENYTCVYNLNGGTLSVGAVITGDATQNFDVNNAYFNFHGGVLKPLGADGDFFRTTITGAKAALAPPHAVVWPEGAVIDTDGHDITIRQPLIAPTGTGVYGDASRALTVLLTGANGGSGYKATPLVRIGVLTSGKNGATAVANVEDDGSGNGTYKIASITITNPGMNYSVAPPLSVYGGDPKTPALPPALTVATNASGSLTKRGQGTLTLTAANSYTGDTLVEGGTLALGVASLHDDSVVHLAAGVTLRLDFGGVDEVRGLCVKGVEMPRGVYRNSDFGGTRISGPGILKVREGKMTGKCIIIR